jgi:ribosome-associated heat shock protein Hsp15
MKPPSIDHPSEPGRAEGATTGDGQRVDKWLWAARFFKTRTLAAEAVGGGHIKVDGQRVKPSKSIRPGMRLEIQRGDVRWELTVQALSKQRRPAKEAIELYAELPQSVSARAAAAEARRLAREQSDYRLGRPTKRDRRQLAEFRGKSS